MQTKLNLTTVKQLQMLLFYLFLYNGTISPQALAPPCGRQAVTVWEQTHIRYKSVESLSSTTESPLGLNSGKNGRRVQASRRVC